MPLRRARSSAALPAAIRLQRLEQLPQLRERLQTTRTLFVGHTSSVMNANAADR
jgi:hypothetical protein